MKENICRFVPFQQDLHTIHTINFVYETKPQIYRGLKIESVYKMHYVYNGRGLLHIQGKTAELHAGDIFFTFPAVPFAIESIENFEYMYISFIGVRANRIMEMLHINSQNYIYQNAAEIAPFWSNGLTTAQQVIDLMSESILLYTFSFLGSKLLPDPHIPKQSHATERIKKYIDDNFSNHNFSLEAMSQELSYNKKYISFIFKKHIGIGIIEYLNIIRIQNACTMMEQGFTSVSDIADWCGFSDSNYFSKKFKERMGVLPTQYIKAQRNNLT